MNKKYKYHIIYDGPMLNYCVETDEFLSDELDIFVHLASDIDYKKYHDDNNYNKWIENNVKFIDIKYIEDMEL